MYISNMTQKSAKHVPEDYHKFKRVKKALFSEQFGCEVSSFDFQLVVGHTGLECISQSSSGVLPQCLSFPLQKTSLLENCRNKHDVLFVPYDLPY